MSFRDFRYHDKAEANLVLIFDEGRATIDAFKREVERVKREWVPPEVEVPQLYVPFAGFHLVFTVAEEDDSILVLAAVEPQS
jgi:hypothetical protein